MAVTVQHPEACIGCGCCEQECPAGVLEVEDAVQIVAAEQCIGCGLCAAACPWEVLAVE